MNAQEAREEAEKYVFNLIFEAAQSGQTSISINYYNDSIFTERFRQRLINLGYEITLPHSIRSLFSQKYWPGSVRW